MKRNSQRNLSIGLLLLVLISACVVSHKFREGMEGNEVEKRLDKMEYKLDDIYEEVVGEERIKTGKYIFYEKGEYVDDLSFILTKKGGNEYSLTSAFEEEKIAFNLELFSDNSMLGKHVQKDTDMISLMFDKSGEFFFVENNFFVHVDYKDKFLEDVKKAKGEDVVTDWDLTGYFDLKVFKNEASEKMRQLKKKEMNKGKMGKKIKD